MARKRGRLRNATAELGGRERENGFYRFSSSNNVAINSLTLGVLEAEASAPGAFSSPPFEGAKASRRTEKANGFGAKSAQGLSKTFEESRAVADDAFVDGINVFFRHRGQRIVRPAKCDATVNFERQDSQKNVILIVANFKFVALNRNES